MNMIRFSILFLAGLVILTGCGAKKTPAPAPAPAAAPAPPAGEEIAVEVLSLPESATVLFQDRERGKTPLQMTVRTFGELTALTARQAESEFREKRIRILAADRVQVIFRFGGEPSALLKKLGLAKAVIFDYSDRAAFDLDKAELKPEILPVLTRQADILNRYFQNIPVFVCGHTDSTGSQAHNLTLSLARAEVVAAYLEKHQVARQRMQVQGFAAGYPLDTNRTETGRAQNRRTELVLPQ